MRPLALVLASLVLAAAGCTDQACPSEAFVVDENGTCADAPSQFTLQSENCSVLVASPSGPTGLPTTGTLGQSESPLRQGGFMLYGTMPAFRLCLAKRVDYRLELSCVDGTGAPVCEAALTEPN